MGYTGCDNMIERPFESQDVGLHLLCDIFEIQEVVEALLIKH